MLKNNTSFKENRRVAFASQNLQITQIAENKKFLAMPEAPKLRIARIGRRSHCQKKIEFTVINRNYQFEKDILKPRLKIKNPLEGGLIF